MRTCRGALGRQTAVESLGWSGPERHRGWAPPSAAALARLRAARRRGQRRRPGRAAGRGTAARRRAARGRARRVARRSVKHRFLGEVGLWILKLDAGLFGMAIAFDVLRAHDLDDLGLGLLNVTAAPSLGYMISQGATTLWESWDGTRHRQVSSRNHMMFGGSAARFLAASVGGLAPLAAELLPRAGEREGGTEEGALEGGAAGLGWERVHVKVAPWALRYLGQSSAERETSLGTLHVSWRREPGGGTGQAELNLTVPRGGAAMVDIPILHDGPGAPDKAREPTAEMLGGSGSSEAPSEAMCQLSCGGVTPVAACAGRVRAMGCRPARGTSSRYLRGWVGEGVHRFRW